MGCIKMYIDKQYFNLSLSLSLPQLTSEALILRRFPDESITSRLWNDHVTEVNFNKDRSTVTVRYKDSNGEYNHHFHTKQVES